MVARNSINLILLIILSQIFTKTPRQWWVGGGIHVGLDAAKSRLQDAGSWRWVRVCIHKPAEICREIKASEVQAVSKKYQSG